MHRPRSRASRSAHLRPTLAVMLSALLGLAALPAQAQTSALLDQVKQNPARGKAMCTQLRQLNAQGTSFTSQQVTALVARQQGISQPDAEILLTYVVGLYCPDVT